MKKEEEIFYKYQAQILDNLDNLRINLQNCEDLGMLDMDEVIYNEIVDLIDETKSVDTIEDLSEIITRAKTLETRVDSWFAKEGIENIEFNWPII
jgi:hypothetical protein